MSSSNSSERQKVEQVSTTSSSCLVCATTSSPVAINKGRALFLCPNCGLRFFDNEQALSEVYARAYEGKVGDAEMHEYRFRRQYLSSMPNTDFMASPAVRLSLDWLSKNARPGATVVDVGCGWGVMLRALRDRGFKVIGTDVAPKVKEMLDAQGFQVYIGSLKEYPATLPQPEYVTNNFVLHHPEDPVRFLRSIAERFPKAPLLLTEGIYPNWMHGIVPTPEPEYPRQLTSWTPKSLSLALEKAGYRRHELLYTNPSPRDVQLPLTPLVARLAPKRREGSSGQEGQGQLTPVHGLKWGIRAVQVAKTLVFGLPALYARIRGLQPLYVLAVAYPDGADTTR